MEATALVPLGMGLIVVGAGMGIGRFAAAAAEYCSTTRSS